jgi:hypothetical protein
MNRREQLKTEAKQNGARLRTMGVYRIRNERNGRVFLDASLNLEGAMDRDRSWLALGGHTNRSLQQDWNACGADAFRFDILETLTPTNDPRDYAGEVALLLEAWMAQLEPYGDKGYLPVPRRMRA